MPRTSRRVRRHRDLRANVRWSCRSNPHQVVRLVTSEYSQHHCARNCGASQLNFMRWADAHGMSMKHLIDAVLQDPVAVLHGKSAAADELVSIGAASLPLVQEVLDGKWTSKAHGVDVIEAFMFIATRIRNRT